MYIKSFKSQNYDIYILRQMIKQKQKQKVHSVYFINLFKEFYVCLSNFSNNNFYDNNNNNNNNS